MAYSALDAAQLLFGAGSYEISTVDSAPININNSAWYNVIGVGAAVFAQDYFRGTDGTTHYQDVWVGDPATDTVSAYVSDFGNSYSINYAFLDTPAPEPASLALLGAGLAGLGWVRRKRGLTASRS